MQLETRPPVAVFNELSFPAISDELSQQELLNLLGKFVDAVRAMVAVRNDLTLVTPFSLASTVLNSAGDTFPAITAISGGSSKDQWRYLARLMSKVPMSASEGIKPPTLDEEYLHDHRASFGLAAALTSLQIAVSLASEPSWDAESIPLSRSWLENTSTGEVVERHETLHVPHVSATSHVAHNYKHLRDMTLPSRLSGADVWATRASRFPHLQFLPHVEGQLSALEPALVQSANTKLSVMEESVATWITDSEVSPKWGTHVTPEYQTRKEKCRFTDLDGTVRYFDLHARFTPGAGRIYFRLDRVGSEGRATIAHIGSKL